MRKSGSISDQRRAVATHKQRVIVTSQTFKGGSPVSIRVLIKDVYYDVGEAVLSELRAGKSPRQLGMEPSLDQAD